MHLTHLSSVLAAALALSLSACSSTGESASAPYSISSEHLTLEGSITRVDKVNRLVTVRGSEGDEIDFEADEEMRNFDQLQVGDLVSLDYSTDVAVEIQPAGSVAAGSTLEESEGTVAEGAKPGASSTGTLTIVAEIVGVDPTANTVTVKGPNGNVVTLDVAREDLRKQLPKLKVGDMLRTTFTEAIAVNVRPRTQ